MTIEIEPGSSLGVASVTAINKAIEDFSARMVMEQENARLILEAELRGTLRVLGTCEPGADSHTFLIALMGAEMVLDGKEIDPELQKLLELARRRIDEVIDSEASNVGTVLQRAVDEFDEYVPYAERQGC